MDERLKKYPKTEMYSVVDTIVIPHPYCITPRHVTYASDKCGGMLTSESIREAEKIIMLIVELKVAIYLMKSMNLD